MTAANVGYLRCRETLKEGQGRSRLRNAGVPDSALFVAEAPEAHPSRLDAAIQAAKEMPAILWVTDIMDLGATLSGIIEALGKVFSAGVTLQIADRSSPLISAEMAAVGSVLQELSSTGPAIQEEQIRKRRAKAIASGKESGRPRAMTPDREDLAHKLFAAGQSVPEVLPQLQALDGPSIQRGALYRWRSENIGDQSR